MKHRRKAQSLSSSILSLTLGSWETLARRTLLIARNKCSPQEYQLMIQEKVEATLESSLIFISSGGLASIHELIEPWNTRVTANLKRLREK